MSTDINTILENLTSVPPLDNSQEKQKDFTDANTILENLTSVPPLDNSVDTPLEEPEEKQEDFSLVADPLDESGEYARLTRGRISADTLSKVQPRTKDLGKEAYEKAIKEEESKTVSALADNKEWIKNAKIIWEQENPGVEFDPEAEGYDSIADWFMDRHSRLGNDLTNLGMTAFKIGDMTKEQQQAWSDSLEQFEVADSDMKSFLRAVKNAALAPETIIGLVGTLGIGALAKLIGGKAAATAAKLSFKKQLIEQLTKRNIVDETVKEVGKDAVVKKTVKEITDDQLKKSAAKAIRAKQVGAGILAGAGYGGGFDVGKQIISAPDAPIDVQESAISTGLGAITGGALSRLTPVRKKAEDIAQAVRKNLDETPSTQNVKVKSLQTETDVIDPSKPLRHRIIEKIAFLNTKTGRFLRSNVGLPKEIFNAALKRERASDIPLTMKQSLKKLDQEIKNDNIQRIKNKVSDRITDEDINNYLDEGIISSSLQGTKVLEALKEVGNIIQLNENKLNDLLGLKGDKKLGVNRGEGKFYITRSFEAVNNPAYLQKIVEATQGKADGEFLVKVEDARKVFRERFPEDSAEEIDDKIVHLVGRLAGKSDSTDFILDVPKILGDLTPKAGTNTGRALNSLKKRKELSQPILNLLGERKDTLGRLSETILTQQKLIKTADYFTSLNQFAQKALEKGEDDAAVIELGGLINFLPKQRARIERKKGDIAPSLARENLEKELVKKGLGETGTKAGVFLKDVWTDENLLRYFDNGVDYWTNTKLGGGAFGNTLAQIAAYGQATQTVLDLPAYIINTLGAAQNLATNGYVFAAIGKDDLISKATNDVLSMYSLGSKEALERLEKLKGQGVVDTELNSEIIRQNINLYGKTLDNPFGRVYKQGMEGLSKAYGVPDTYAKLIAHEIEYRSLKNIYGDTVPDDKLFEMASEIVRDVMPSYSVAAPGARMLSRLPIGTYALFPSEMVRTTFNIGKLSLLDIGKGINEIRKGNTKVGKGLIARGTRRGSGLAATTWGLDAYVDANNELLVSVPTEEQLVVQPDGSEKIESVEIKSAPELNKILTRALNIMGPTWARGSKPYILEGAKENEQGEVIIRYANSSQYDALDFGKVAVRLTGQLLGGEELTKTELDDAYKGLVQSVMGPYTSPKFVVDALINVAASMLGYGDLYAEEQEGTSNENLKRTALEFAEVLEPGTSQAIRAYIDTMAASEIQEVARNSYGFPLTMNDVTSWLTTGQRTTTNDLNKSIGYTVFKDLRKLDLSDRAFTSYLRKLKPRQMTSEIMQDIITSYKNNMEVKKRNFNRLKDKMNLFAQIPYEDKDGNDKFFGEEKLYRSIAGRNNRNAENANKAIEIMKGPFSKFILNPSEDENLTFLLQEKFGEYNPTGIIGELAKVYNEEVSKSQQGEE